MFTCNPQNLNYLGLSRTSTVAQWVELLPATLVSSFLLPSFFLPPFFFFILPLLHLQAFLSTFFGQRLITPWRHRPRRKPPRRTPCPKGY